MEDCQKSDEFTSKTNKCAFVGYEANVTESTIRTSKTAFVLLMDPISTPTFLSNNSLPGEIVKDINLRTSLLSATLM